MTHTAKTYTAADLENLEAEINRLRATLWTLITWLAQGAPPALPSFDAQMLLDQLSGYGVNDDPR